MRNVALGEVRCNKICVACENTRRTVSLIKQTGYPRVLANCASSREDSDLPNTLGQYLQAALWAAEEAT